MRPNLTPSGKWYDVQEDSTDNNKPAAQWLTNNRRALQTCSACTRSLPRCGVFLCYTIAALCSPCHTSAATTFFSRDVRHRGARTAVARGPIACRIAWPLYRMGRVKGAQTKFSMCCKGRRLSQGLVILKELCFVQDNNGAAN
jgi:hypothetical protein